MKIGEAGEAFFVFETDEDVPADLMTSPILQATNPSDAQLEQQQHTGRFGAQNSDTSLGDQQSDADLKGITQEEEERKPPGDVGNSYDILLVLLVVH